MVDVVVDASALIDLLLANDRGQAIRWRLAGQLLHAPSHIDAEVLAALGRLHRAGHLSAEDVETTLRSLATAPLVRHPLQDLLLGAWARRHRLSLSDALYVELAAVRGWRLVTTDHRPPDVPSGDIDRS